MTGDYSVTGDKYLIVGVSGTERDGSVGEMGHVGERSRNRHVQLELYAISPAIHALKAPLGLARFEWIDDDEHRPGCTCASGFVRMGCPGRA